MITSAFCVGAATQRSAGATNKPNPGSKTPANNSAGNQYLARRNEENFKRKVNTCKMEN